MLCSHFRHNSERVNLVHGIGVSVAVIKDEQVLLIQREDFEVWGLPSGEVEVGESLIQAAIREVKEETGFTVRLTRLVGLYTKPQWAGTGMNATGALFAAEIIGGALAKSTDETRDARFFSIDELPENTIWWAKRQIFDALNGVCGIVCVQDANWVEGNPSRRDLYEMRDKSPLSSVEFFNQLFPQADETIEIEGYNLTI